MRTATRTVTTKPATATMLKEPTKRFTGDKCCFIFVAAVVLRTLAGWHGNLWSSTGIFGYNFRTTTKVATVPHHRSQLFLHAAQSLPYCDYLKHDTSCFRFIGFNLLIKYCSNDKHIKSRQHRTLSAMAFQNACPHWHPELPLRRSDTLHELLQSLTRNPV